MIAEGMPWFIILTIGLAFLIMGLMRGKALFRKQKSR